MVRLNKFLAQRGYASRRGADALILKGQVTLNGTVVRELGVQVDAEKDVVLVRGSVVAKENSNKVYLMLNKPRGYVTTLKDKHAELVVVELLPKIAGLVPVGRLDKDSEGLLLFSNDGDFVFEMTHPAHEVSKVYEVQVRGLVDERTLRKLRDGVELEEGIAKAEVRVLSSDGDTCWLEIVLRQGWKRQIRRMCGAVGLDVRVLRRVRIGKLELGDLKLGAHRFVKREEV